MRRLVSKRTTLAIVAAALLLGGAGAAIAATRSSSPAPTAQRQAFLNDLAHRLGVSPAKLEAALKGSLLDRLNEAVAAGRLTQVQAAQLRRRIESSATFPFAPLGAFAAPPPFGRVPGGFALRSLLAPASSYLGVTRARLAADLRGGQSLAAVARAQHKSVAGLERVLTSAASARLAAAVSHGAISSAREKTLVQAFDARLDALVARRVPLGPGGFGPAFRRAGPGFGGVPLFGPAGDAPGLRRAGPGFGGVPLFGPAGQ